MGNGGEEYTDSGNERFSSNETTAIASVSFRFFEREMLGCTMQNK